VLSAKDVLARLEGTGFEPTEEVLLEKGAPDFETAEGGASPGGVQITGYRLNEVEIAADVSRAAWLVLADSNYPGWRVTVDGRERELFTADYILRAVPLEAGRHRVVFSYSPSLFALSSLVSLGALLLIAVGLAGVRSRRKRAAG
jgi:hypothetical protein